MKHINFAKLTLVVTAVLMISNLAGGQQVPLCSSTATADTCSIDNFTSPTAGKVRTVGPITSGNVEVTQKSSGAVGGSRTIYLGLSATGEPAQDNEFNQPAQVQVVPSATEGVPSALVTSYGYQTFGDVIGRYGASAPMSLNLSDEWGIRFYFDGLEYGANFNVEVWNPGIWADCGINIPEDYRGPNASSSFTVDFPESQITGFNPIDWSNITYVLFEIQASGSFGITSIQAIPASVSEASPATFTCQ